MVPALNVVAPLFFRGLHPMVALANELHDTEEVMTSTVPVSLSLSLDSIWQWYSRKSEAGTRHAIWVQSGIPGVHLASVSVAITIHEHR